jgi:hypothetical protein
VQGFAFKEFSGSPELDHRGGRRGVGSKEASACLPLRLCQ